MGGVMRALALIILVALVVGCNESATINGKEVPCIGVERLGEDPRYVYKMDTNNVVIAVIFCELIIPPIVVVMDELYCLIALKGPTSPAP